MLNESNVSKEMAKKPDSGIARRALIKLAAGSLAAGTVAATVRSASAGELKPVEVVPAAGVEGSVYYTEANPGRWSKKIKGHLPVLSAKKTDSGLTITINTAHEMKGFEHYIVKHVLLDKNYNVMGEKMFDPTKEFTPKSIFELSGQPYSGTLYAVSLCNKHDAWLNSIEV